MRLTAVCVYVGSSGGGKETGKSCDDARRAGCQEAILFKPPLYILQSTGGCLFNCLRLAATRAGNIPNKPQPKKLAERRAEEVDRDVDPARVDAIGLASEFQPDNGNTKEVAVLCDSNFPSLLAHI